MSVPTDPAFPQEWEFLIPGDVPNVTRPGDKRLMIGLTKRELAAMFALQGMVAGSQGLQISVEQFAAQSVKLADALLAALAADKIKP